MLSIKDYILSPRTTAIVVIEHFGQWLPDKVYLKLIFWLKMGRRLNLVNPQTFSEKLQWLKLYNRDSKYTTMVDKYAVKDYVARIIGDEYIIPTLGVWDKPENIDWDRLPDQFVLKTTHGGGNTGVVICRDKGSFDKKKAVDKLNKSLKQDIYRTLREWPYKNVPRRIIAEKYIEPDFKTRDLPDYKFFCFGGEPKYCQVISGRDTEMCIDFFDYDWNHQKFQTPQKYPFAKETPAKPVHFEVMWKAAQKLAQGKPFSRIDFYSTGDSVFFGEITFFPTSGMGGFKPDQYDELLGSMISLPGVKLGGVIINVQQNNEIVINKPDLPDYKFFCFDGEVKALFIGTERGSGDVKFDFYDSDFNHLNLVQSHPMSGRIIEKPLNFDKMKDLAAKLSKGIPHVRVDLYNVNGKILFGELTFFHHGGITSFHPESWDYTFGSWIQLPINKQ